LARSFSTEIHFRINVIIFDNIWYLYISTRMCLSFYQRSLKGKKCGGASPLLEYNGAPRIPVSLLGNNARERTA